MSQQLLSFFVSFRMRPIYESTGEAAFMFIVLPCLYAAPALLPALPA